MRRRLVVVLACTLAVAAFLPGAAQIPQQRPVFKGGAVLVNVDAYPRRDGKIVEGLTKADFEVFEDGKPQEIDDFEFVKVGPITADADLRDPTSIADSERQAADPHNRVFVIYLDIFHVGLFGSHYTRAPVMAFLQRTIGPTDLFAAMTPETPASSLTFGRRSETLETELAKYWDWGESNRLTMPRNPAESQMMMCPNGEALLAAFREDESATNLEQMVARLGNLRDHRKNILFISEGWHARGAARIGSSSGRYPHIPTVGMGPGGRLGMSGDMWGGKDAAWCDTQMAYYRGIDYARRFQDLLESSRRANVAFYPVDVGGLRAPIGGAPIDHGPTDLLLTLAENTGGKAVVNTNDLVTGVRKISDDLSAYYLFTYYSGNTAADGQFRRIEVKVERPGVKVSARPGYLAPTEEMRKAEAAAAAKPVREASPVDLELGRLSRLRTDARIYTAAINSASGLDIVIELPGSAVSSNDWRKGATVKVEVTPKDGAAAVSGEGKIEAGLRSVVVKVPLTATPASGWRVRVRATGAGEPADDDFDVAPAAKALVSEPTVFRASTPARSPLRPVADYKFFRTERLHAEWTLAKALDDRTARLLNRRGEALAIPVTLTERPDGDRKVLAADVSLAPLADGDYVIEVSATAGSEKVQKLLAFRVVR